LLLEEEAAAIHLYHITFLILQGQTCEWALLEASYWYWQIVVSATTNPSSCYGPGSYSKKNPDIPTDRAWQGRLR